MSTLLTIITLLTMLPSGGSCAGTLPSGRQVIASSDGWFLSAEFQDEFCQVRFPEGRVIITSDAVSVRRLIIPLDPAAKRVNLNSRQGHLEIIADGVTVYHGSPK